MRLEFIKVSRYAIFGLLFNIFAYALYSLLTFTDTFSTEAQRLVVSALILFPFVFLVNRKFVFHSNNKMSSDLYRYSIIYFAAIAYGLVGLTISLLFFSNPYIAQAVSSIFVLTTTFAVNNLWTFKQGRHDSPN